MRPSGSLLLLLLLTACEEATVCERAAEFDPVLEPGVGEDAFAPLADGDVLTADFGNQGGQHVWLALRAEGVNPGVKNLLGGDRDAPRVDVLLLDAEGAVWGEGHSQATAFVGNEAASELTGLQLFLDFYANDADLDLPEEFRLAVTLEDSCGTTLTVERRVGVE